MEIRDIIGYLPRREIPAGNRDRRQRPGRNGAERKTGTPRRTKIVADLTFGRVNRRQMIAAARARAGIGTASANVTLDAADRRHAGAAIGWLIVSQLTGREDSLWTEKS